MEDTAGWLDLDGYGIYVWPSYGLALLVLLALLVQAVSAWRRARRQYEAMVAPAADETRQAPQRTPAA